MEVAAHFFARARPPSVIKTDKALRARRNLNKGCLTRCDCRRNLPHLRRRTVTKTRWKLVAAASGAALLSIAAAPRAARAYRSWTAARRQARIAQAWASVKAGQDYLTFNPAAEDDGREEPSNRLVPEQDDPMLRGLANAAEWGYRSGAFLMQKLQVTAAEARKWAHLMPQTS